MLSTRDVEEVHMIPGAPAATEALHRSKCLCLHCCHQGLWQALAFGTPDVPPLAFFLPFWSDFFASHHQIVSARRLSLYHMFCLKNPNCYLLLGVIYIYILYISTLSRQPFLSNQRHNSFVENFTNLRYAGGLLCSKLVKELRL